MKAVALIMIVVLTGGISGCAKKTASEQLQEDMKKAGNQMQKELDSWK
jgi:hypothetical protein